MPTRQGTDYNFILPMNPLAEDVIAEAAAADAAEAAAGANAPAHDVVLAAGDLNPDAVGLGPAEVPVAAPPVAADALPAEPLGAGALTGANTTVPFRGSTLPKDAIRLSKFKGDNDTASQEDFLFNLELFFEAQPHVYDESLNSNALRLRLVVLAGCFPPGSVASVWFRSLYRRGLLVSYEVFLQLFNEQFQQAASNLVSLQTKWEDARQLRTQSVNAYYAYLLQQQAAHAAIAWEYRPSEHTLLTKFCASLRPDLKRFLQEKRIDHPDYSISQLVQAASIRESTTRSAPSTLHGHPELNAWNGRPAAGNANPTQKWCFFCKSTTHNDTECRKILAKKARGEWKERPRPAGR